MNLNDLIKKKNKKTKAKLVGKIAAGVGVGAAIGAVAGTLLAPKSGKETREDIAKGAKDVLEKAKESAIEVKAKVTKVLEKQDLCCENTNECCCDKDSKECCQEETKECCCCEENTEK